MWQDEASTAVDALSIMRTGKDRSGQPWPVISPSFGDYPLAGYRYALIPVIKTLGLSIGTHRLVSAIAGTVLLLACALLVRGRLGDRAALGALLSGAITPTWIHYSRYGSEAMLLPACLALGVLFAEKARRSERPGWLYASALALGASAYTYHAVKLMLPLWGLALLWLEWPYVRALFHKNKWSVLGPVALLIALGLPAASAALSPEGMARANQVAVWNDHPLSEALAIALKNYLSFFEPAFLFERASIYTAMSFPGLGAYSLLDAPFIPLGAVLALWRRGVDRFYGFVLLWLLIGPIPGAIGSDAHNCGRVVGWLPALPMLAAIGFGAVLGALLRLGRLGRALTLLPLAAVYLYVALGTVHRVMVVYPRTADIAWQFEPNRALVAAREQRGDRRVIVSPAFQMAELFAKFHLDGVPWSLGSRGVVAPDEIYAAPADKVPVRGVVLTEIKDHDGKVKARVFLSE
jgi:4-amino-4-deoxy-L-arabinose transferase-like glycosyltransferase